VQQVHLLGQLQKQVFAYQFAPTYGWGMDGCNHRHIFDWLNVNSPNDVSPNAGSPNVFSPKRH
jgi:hypothetical protein